MHADTDDEAPLEVVEAYLEKKICSRLDHMPIGHTAKCMTCRAATNSPPYKGIARRAEDVVLAGAREMLWYESTEHTLLDLVITQ
jgi:hypothetical protein